VRSASCWPLMKTQTKMRDPHAPISTATQTVYPALERYSIVYWECGSETYFDYDENVPLGTECWRCGVIINGEL